ncbi:MAG: pilin [Candidatus Nanosyncoccaceae bacterium]|jgi:hypothetical protein
MRRILATVLILVGMVSLNLLFSEYTFAANCDGKILGIPTWYRGLIKEEKGRCVVMSPEEAFNGPKDEAVGKYITKIVLNVADMLMRLVGLVSFGLILYSGFTYITSGGSAQRVESAKKTLRNAVIGLVIALLATAIVNLVLGMV